MKNKLRRALKSRLRPITGAKSVYFFTLHKCASSLFAGFVLKNIEGMNHVDHAREMYRGTAGDAPAKFRRRGYVYGPIRIINASDTTEYQRLILPVTRPGFIADKRAVIFVRDPRDILVSEYFSFGFTHALSKVEEFRERQLKQREIIQAQTLDEYALGRAEDLAARFATLQSLADTCQDSIILRYEDMVNDFPEFSAALTAYLPMSPATQRKMERRSRPKTAEEPDSHRRSGKTQGFHEKLLPGTVEQLNAVLGITLRDFKYDL